MVLAGEGRYSFGASSYYPVLKFLYQPAFPIKKEGNNMKFSDPYCEGNRLLDCDLLKGTIGKVRGIGLDDDDEDLCDECNSTTA
ncbi:MAG: hypothetical protein AB1629_08385, partial [Candidatus Omnitrophota bacterium]